MLIPGERRLQLLQVGKRQNLAANILDVLLILHIDIQSNSAKNVDGADHIHKREGLGEQHEAQHDLAAHREREDTMTARGKCQT